MCRRERRRREHAGECLLCASWVCQLTTRQPRRRPDRGWRASQWPPRQCTQGTTRCPGQRHLVHTTSTHRQGVGRLWGVWGAGGGAAGSGRSTIFTRGGAREVRGGPCAAHGRQWATPPPHPPEGEFSTALPMQWKPRVHVSTNNFKQARGGLPGVPSVTTTPIARCTAPKIWKHGQQHRCTVTRDHHRAQTRGRARAPSRMRGTRATTNGAWCKLTTQVAFMSTTRHPGRSGGGGGGWGRGCRLCGVWAM